MSIYTWTYEVSIDLLEYGEDEVSSWVLTCTNDEFLRLSNVANWLIYHGPTQKSGHSLSLAKALSLAAVYVKEGAPRNLAKERRKKVNKLTKEQLEAKNNKKGVDEELRRSKPTYYGVGSDAKKFWGKKE